MNIFHILLTRHSIAIHRSDSMELIHFVLLWIFVVIFKYKIQTVQNMGKYCYLGKWYCYLINLFYLQSSLLQITLRRLLHDILNQFTFGCIETQFGVEATKKQ